MRSSRRARDVQPVESVVREYLLSEHAALVRATSDCADAVVADWSDGVADGRAAVVGPLEAELRARGVLAALPAVLAGAVDAAGYRLRSRPVAAPPYVVVTSLGPVLRATVEDGRLVVTFQVFDVEHESTRRYVRSATTPAEIVSVSFR